MRKIFNDAEFKVNSAIDRVGRNINTIKEEGV